MRADRLLSLLMILQLRGRTTAGDLSAQLEVSVRTVYRDIEALIRSGVPIQADRGRTGGVRLARGYQTRLTGLSADEAQALPFASVAVAAAALGFAGTAESARLKVLAALPLTASEQAYHASERFYLDPADWYRRPATPQHLRPIATAVWAGQIVQIHYESWRGRKMRLVEPLGLVLKAGTWYMIGRRARQVSIYRVESVRSVRILPGKFVQPRNFDLAAEWQKEVSRFETSLRRTMVDVTIHHADNYAHAKMVITAALALRLPAMRGRPVVIDLPGHDPRLTRTGRCTHRVSRRSVINQSASFI